ncbi:hypothetical protein LguiB_020536 [Lonicera macranthoides]
MAFLEYLAPEQSLALHPIITYFEGLMADVNGHVLARGVLVKPNEPYILQRDDDVHGNPKRLRISQASILATLADRSGLWTSRSVVRCAVGSKPPVFICSLSIGEVASCKLDLEFEEKDDVVFSVKGPRGIHLAGYFLNSTGANSTSTILTTDAPKLGLEGKDNIAKPSCEGPNNFNSQDRNTTHIDELEDEVGEYSRIKNVDRVVNDANEEHLNEKTNKSCEEVDKIHAADRSVVNKCDSEVVKEVDPVLGDGGKLNTSSSSEKLLLQENGNVLWGDHGGVFAMESVDIGGIKGVDDRKQSPNEKLADVTDE